MGRKTLVIPTDVTDEEAVKAGVQKAIDVFGKIDILLSKAGIAMLGGVENITEEDWDTGIVINVKGPFFLSKYVIPHMRKAKYGKIINITSVNPIIADKSPIL